MDAFISCKRQRLSDPTMSLVPASSNTENTMTELAGDDESTDFKLALLLSLHPSLGEEALLEALLASDGSVEQASEALKLDLRLTSSPRKKFAPARDGTGYQSSLFTFSTTKERNGTEKRTQIIKKRLTKKGQTLYLYAPADVEAHTPCSIIHNFLPREQADALLLELLKEAPTFNRDSFKLFDRVVTSPHSFCFYVDGWDEVEKQRTEYVYNGGAVKDVRPSLPEMLKASTLVQEAVNGEIQRRLQNFYPNGKKLKYQSPQPWKPNTAFVNCYDGPTENVGYHTDELTYLGPRAVIGSLSLGVAREFRIRKIVAQDDNRSSKEEVANAQGQISIRLPHNSLLVMHAEMQEEWKHSIAPARSIEPHPLAKNKRINITYRCYKDSLHPKFTPKCMCGIAAALRCMQKKKESRGRYFWMCHASFQPDIDGCSFFKWAEFDEDGEPPWASRRKTEATYENPESEMKKLTEEIIEEPAESS
ncbi:hypothetical protein GQ43DRAFT_382527 [Delitschia confertaspora ATCC 74209]|uniref:Fe2OG dioxygenase domain-containing protein n=1 Tax=Delitschia confertaspora ATCC 74209 TaxID=1513339 RepID=A0A9P4JCR2_9PLEO|nr:hypothetical protein GQ43DRAFT_382527 [Delitschia confertaspora ATCC 74209]